LSADRNLRICLKNLPMRRSPRHEVDPLCKIFDGVVGQELFAALVAAL
jgi:hypothetical protein